AMVAAQPRKPSGVPWKVCRSRVICSQVSEALAGHCEKLQRVQAVDDDNGTVVRDKPPRYSRAGSLTDDADWSVMRVAVRPTAIAAAGSILAGPAVACSAAASAPSKHASGTAAGGDVRAAQTARAKPSPTPASPGVQVTGAPSGVKAKGGVLANAATGGLLWS